MAFAEPVDGRDQLFLSAFDGSDRRRVVIGSITAAAAYGPSVEHEDQVAYMLGVNLSPDGERIALAVKPYASARRSQVIVVNRDGTGARTASPVLPVGDVSVSWSPDQTKLAYFVVPEWETPKLWVTDLTTDELTHFEVGYLSGHAWADDSAAIYFWKDSNTSYESSVFKLDLASGQVETVRENVPGWVYGLRGGVVLAECLDAQYRGTLFDFELSDDTTRIIRTAATAPGRVVGYYLDADGYAAIGMADSFGVYTNYLMTNRDDGFVQIDPGDMHERHKGDFHPE